MFGDGLLTHELLNPFLKYNLGSILSCLNPSLENCLINLYILYQNFM